MKMFTDLQSLIVSLDKYFARKKKLPAIRKVMRLHKLLTMKILILLLLPLFGMGQTARTFHESAGKYYFELHWKGKEDTIGLFEAKPATILVQFTPRDAITVRDVYLINGEPWVKQREKWVKVKAYRWKLSNGWSK